MHLENDQPAKVFTKELRESLRENKQISLDQNNRESIICVKYHMFWYRKDAFKAFIQFNINFSSLNMTEYSKGSRNMKAQTVSNTGGNSGQGPTHPYSDHSHSASRYSQDQPLQSSSGESPEDNFELAIQYIMPLVSAVKQENEHLKQQRQQVQEDMQKLNQLAQGLLAENQQLRKHHAMRTQDIRKLIETISINTHEETTDINHQAFLLRESNHALVKKIEAEMRVSAEGNAEIGKGQQQLDNICQQSQIDQQSIRDLQIKNKQLFYRCEQLRRQVESLDPASDNETVHEALVEVVALRNKNRQDVLRAKSLLMEHREERPFIEENHASVAQQNKQLKAEEQQLRETASNGQSRLEQLKISYNQSVDRFTESFRNYERAKNQINQNEEELVKIREAIAESKAKARKSESLIKQLRQQKQVLKAKMALKKESTAKLQNQRLQVREKHGRQVKAQINKVKEQMSKSIAKINEEINKKIAPEAASVNIAISQAKEQYAELVQQVQDLEDSMRKLQNPRKEIIRLEYQLKKMNLKKN